MNCGILSLEDIIQVILLSAAVFIPLGFALGKSRMNARFLWLWLTHRSSIRCRGQLLENLEPRPKGEAFPDSNSSSPPADRIPRDSDHTGSGTGQKSRQD